MKKVLRHFEDRQTMATATMRYTAKEELQLIRSILQPDLMMEPLKFVMFAFPWGVEGMPLARHQGPRAWQREVLEEIGAHNWANAARIKAGEDPKPFNLAVASGRGVGKSALVAWLQQWMQSIAIGSTTIVTANTEAQLKSRTWAEVGKWHTLAINSHWFDRTATTLKPAPWFGQSMKADGWDTEYYYAQTQLWSEENPDAFAGIHNPNGVMLIMDEASGIPQSIYTVSEGFFTEPVPYRYWLTFSNPRRPTGAFFNSFQSKEAEFWSLYNIDSRTVEGTDKAVYDKIIKKYGEDSDEARVEVKGLFPRTGSNQLIGYALVEEAVGRQVRPRDAEGFPKIMGIDVARFGEDKTVIQKLQGSFAHEPVELADMDNMRVAGIIAVEADMWEPDAIFIDVGGGQGVIDRLRQLGYNVIEINFGQSADNKEVYSNKRIEMWDRVKEWLEQGGVIPDHERLKQDLNAPNYSYAELTNKKLLESKLSMGKRGLPSTDFGDALALCFAFKVAPGGWVGHTGGGRVVDSFDPFAMD